MAGKVTWAVGGLIGGALTYALAKYLLEEDEGPEIIYRRSEMSDEFLKSVLEKMKEENDAKALYDFGCILEKEDKNWAVKFIKAAADMDFMIAQNKLRCMEN